MSEKSALSIIIDAPIEEVDNLLKVSHYNITALTNMKKGLELQYQRVEVTKNMLIEGIVKGEVHQDGDSETLNDLYIILQRIEERATLLQQYINELKVDKRN
jgi:hypothetical protein